MSSVAKGASGQRGFWSALLQVGLYKPNQGKVVRQVTFFGSALLALLSVYQISTIEIWEWLLSRVGGESMGSGAPWIVLVGLGALALWVCFRVVNYPKFADFLIAVEAEMNKVSWPSKQELWRASVVVIFVIFAMAALLFLFDIVWTFVFQSIGIRYKSG